MTAPEAGRGATMACVGVLLVGAAARLWAHATAGSLWLDELFLAQNLEERSFAELLRPLDHGQNAPVGWLMLQEAVHTWVGRSAAVLRLPATLASLACLPLAFLLARRLVGRKAALPALVVLSCSPLILWLGLQAKQYAFDLLASLVLLTLASGARQGPRGRIWRLGAVGVLALWTSMPAVFVAAAVGVVLFVESLRQVPRDPQRVRALAVVGVAWLACFVVNYLWFLQPREQAEWLYGYWAPGFPDGWSDFLWLPRVLAGAMSDPLGFYGVGAVAVVPVLWGAWSLLRAPDPGRRAGGWLLVLPVAFTLAAAAAHLYPFTIRLVLFLAPCLALLFGAGVEDLARVLPRVLVRAGTVALLTVPTGLLLLWLPRGGLPIAAESRPLCEQAVAEVQAQDVLVVESMATHAWRYYGGPVSGEVRETEPGWNDAERIQGVADVLEECQAPRAWLLLSRVADPAPGSARAAWKEDLAQRDFLWPRTWRWFLQQRTGWPTRDDFRRILPQGWTLTEEWRTHGACLWLLVRDDR